VEEMADVAGPSHANTHTKLHRIRKLLSMQFNGESQ
jgi:hypothetical protein